MKVMKFFHDSLSPLKRGGLFYLGFLGVIGMFLPFINVYFRQELGFSGRQIAMLSILGPLMTLTVAIPIASLADRHRWRIPILMVAITGFGLMMFFVRLPHSFILVAPLWLVMTVFMCPIMPIADSVISGMAVRHSLNYGSMRLWGSASFAVTSVGCGALWPWIGFGAMFIVAGLSFLGIVLFFASKLEEAPAPVEPQSRPSFWEIRRDRGLIILIITAFFIGASMNISIVYDGIYMTTLGGTGLLIGLMFSLTAAAELPMMHYRERIVRLLSIPGTLLFAYVLFIVAFLGYALAWRPWMLLITSAIKGLGFGLFFSSAVQFISERVPESWSSTIQTIFTASMFGVAPLFAAPLGGELFDRFGPKAVFIYGSLSVIGATSILLFAIGKGIFVETKR